MFHVLGFVVRGNDDHDPLFRHYRPPIGSTAGAVQPITPRREGPAVDFLTVSARINTVSASVRDFRGSLLSVAVPMKKTTIFAAVFISLVLAPAAALCRTDSPSARSLAMGDAVTAIGMGTDGLFVNPGAIGQVTQYSVNIGYGYANINQWHQASASFVDSQTNKWLTGGLAYTFGYADKAGDTMTHDIRVALGTKYATDKVFIGFGVGMRIMNLSSDRSNRPGMSIPTSAPFLG